MRRSNNAAPFLRRDPVRLEERRPHMGVVMLYVAHRGYVARQHLPRVDPCPAIGRNTHQRQTLRLMGLQCLLPAPSSPSFESNRALLQLQSRTCKSRQAHSNGQLQMNHSTGSVMDQSHHGRMRRTAISTSIVHPILVHPTTSIKSMRLFARIAGRRMLVQR